MEEGKIEILYDVLVNYEVINAKKLCFQSFMDKEVIVVDDCNIIYQGSTYRILNEDETDSFIYDVTTDRIETAIKDLCQAGYGDIIDYIDFEKYRWDLDISVCDEIGCLDSWDEDEYNVYRLN